MTLFLYPQHLVWCLVCAPSIQQMLATLKWRAFDDIEVLQNLVKSEGKLQAWWQFSDAALNLASWKCPRVGKSQTTHQIRATTCFLNSFIKKIIFIWPLSAFPLQWQSWARPTICTICSLRDKICLSLFWKTDGNKINIHYLEWLWWLIEATSITHLA